jgi:TolA-binding protein
MKRYFLLGAILSFSLGGFSRGSEVPTLEKAIAPLEDGIPEVTVQRLEQVLAGNPVGSERERAELQLGRALVETGRPNEALKLLGQPSLTNSGEANFWYAQALASLKRWAEALPHYQNAARDPRFSMHPEAIFGESESLRALGRQEEAIQVLRSLERIPDWSARAKLGIANLLIDSGDLTDADHLLRETKPQRLSERNQRRLLLGRLSLAQGNPTRAIEALSVLLKKTEGVSHPILVATLFALADAHLRAGAPESGDDALEEFIDHHPNDEALPEIFAKLDQLYQHERKPSTNELERWMRDLAQPRQVLAQWYFARNRLRAGNGEQAMALLMELEQSNVRLPSLGDADLELARVVLAKGQWQMAIAAAEAGRTQNAAPAFREQADWLIADANYQGGQLEKAAAIYEQLADRVAPNSADARFNAAVCWLRLDRANEFTTDYRKISTDSSGQDGSNLLLEQGLVQAAQGKREAEQTLQNFIRNFPQSPRISEAWVALAELAFHAGKPDLTKARQDLSRAREGNPTAAAVERADYLQVWLEDATSSPDQTALVAAANQFLQRHPSSPFAAEVRMKLAEAYYRRGDFANAQTQFEVLVQQRPDTPLAEKALFFAARSAMSSMGSGALDHALALLDQVVKMGGDLKWAARNEEATIERRLGKNVEALALYDEVLKNDAKPAERREALCGKGDIYYDMGAADTENYRRAIDLYEQLATESGVPAFWRNQARFKKGKALEKLDDKPAALSAYYNVIEEGVRPDVQHEFFWFYKAGFNAGHLLEESQDWKSAVAVYRKLAAVGGSRSDEAKARLTQLRLEHFLWEE